MKLTKKKAFGAFMAVLLCAGLMVPTAALAWTINTEGNDEDNNSTNYSGETSGESEVHGWIGTFDNEEDPDPEAPEPPDDAWINVSVPTRILFGSLATDNGTVYSPNYHVYNHSARGVEVTPTAFAENASSSDDATYLSGMELTMDFSTPVFTETIRATDDTFLFGGTNAFELDPADTATDTPAQGDFKINGQLPAGFTYPTIAQGPYEPEYTLTFAFSSVAPDSIG